MPERGRLILNPSARQQVEKLVSILQEADLGGAYVSESSTLQGILDGKRKNFTTIEKLAEAVAKLLDEGPLPGVFTMSDILSLFLEGWFIRPEVLEALHRPTESLDAKRQEITDQIETLERKLKAKREELKPIDNEQRSHEALRQIREETKTINTRLTAYLTSHPQYCAYLFDGKECPIDDPDRGVVASQVIERIAHHKNIMAQDEHLIQRHWYEVAQSFVAWYMACPVYREYINNRPDCFSIYQEIWRLGKLERWNFPSPDDKPSGQ
jgi:hypothetical protein